MQKTYNCEELARHTKEYADLNFTKVAKTEEFLGLPYQDVKMRLSSDEIMSMPKKMCLKSFCDGLVIKSLNERNFADLFREVRLIHVSRDFLLSHVVTIL